ncbi:TPA: lipoate--protein ligase family protein [Candidatus Woesearchaeota archaeon]|nr:lipoate--protein ligase family protein [Candidatus Woesearchaeota archaeon]HIJ18576.1 lipoate--protein ligase family protein [Candidatus Woesearchaeota archaeon]
MSQDIKKWRLIELERHGAAMNMAIDQAIAEQAALGNAPPTMRFYQWESPSISLGAYQSLADINVEACARHAVALVRRMTGGRAVYHSTADFTYAVIVPIRMFNYSITTAYRSICNSILVALKKLGIRGQLEHSNDVVVDGKKISGNAAKVLDSGWYVQHGTIHYGIDHRLLGELFGSDRKLFEDKATGIREHSQASQEDVYKALREGFTADKEFVVGFLSPQESLRAHDLEFMKYRSVALPNGAVARQRGACSVLPGGRL